MNLTIKFTDGDNVTIENLQRIRPNGDDSLDQTDYSMFVPSPRDQYAFIGSNAILTVDGKDIRFLYFYESRQN